MQKSFLNVTFLFIISWPLGVDTTQRPIIGQINSELEGIWNEAVAP